MDTNEAAKTLGRLGGLAKSEGKTKAVRENVAKAVAQRRSYKIENEELRIRINKMRSYILDQDESATDVAGEEA